MRSKRQRFKPFQAIIIVVWKPSENPYNVVAALFFLAFACCCFCCCFEFLRCAWSWCLTKIIRGEPGLFLSLSFCEKIWCCNCFMFDLLQSNFPLGPFQNDLNSNCLTFHAACFSGYVHVLVRSVLMLLVHIFKIKMSNNTVISNTKYA